MRKWAVIVVGLWVGGALVMFTAQYLKRTDRCSGTSPCAIALAKGVFRSAFWPVYSIIDR
jgi:hypothetical protein